MLQVKSKGKNIPEQIQVKLSNDDKKMRRCHKHTTTHNIKTVQLHGAMKQQVKLYTVK